MGWLTSKVERVVDARNGIGETPVWNVREQALYWIDCEHPPELLRWKPGSDSVQRWPMPERIGGFVFKRGGGALVALASGLFDLDFTTGNLSRRARSPLPDHVALHECACDPSGRFWVGAIDRRIGADNPFPGGAKLFRLDGNELVPMIDEISCANGLAFAPDGRTLYISDSTTRRCDRWDLDPATGEIMNRQTLFALGDGEGFVDGAAVDAEGGYWAALVYVGRLRRYLPDGSPDLEIPLPFDNPTKPAFGGPDLRTIYITSTSEALGGPAANPLDGGLFALDVDVVGRPDTLFPE
jgi:L-arabinonolactonase